MTDSTANETGTPSAGDRSRHEALAEPGVPEGAENTGTIPYAFRYRLPDEFAPVSNPADPEDWADVLQEQLPSADAAEARVAAQQLSQAHAWLVALGETPTDMAMCIGAESVKGKSKLSVGMIMVSVRHTGHQDRLLAAEGIYRSKEHKLFAGETRISDLDFPLGKGVQGRQDSLLAAKLPCGPGIMSVSLRTLELNSPAHTPSGCSAQEDGKVVVARPRIPMAALQLIIPAPADYCVYVTISTPSVYLLDAYCERLSHIGRTFSFE